MAGGLQGRQGQVDAPRPSAVPRPVALRILVGAQLSGPTVCVQPSGVRESTLGWRSRGGLPGGSGPCVQEPALSPSACRAVLVSPALSVQMLLCICPAWAASSHLLAVTCPRAAPA